MEGFIDIFNIKVLLIYTFNKTFPIFIGYRVGLRFSYTHFGEFTLTQKEMCQMSEINWVQGGRSCLCRVMEGP